MTLLLITVIVAVAIVLFALFSWAASLPNLVGRRQPDVPGEDGDGRRQAEHDAEQAAWPRGNVRRIVEPREPKP